MSIDGRIDINVLFQDKSGQRLKVVSLNDSKEYTTGKVAIVSGTVGTAQKTIELDNVYRDASGELVQFVTPQRIAFSCNSLNSRVLQNLDGGGVVDMLLRSSGGQAAVSSFPNILNLLIRSGSSTGTYAIVLYGDGT